MRTGERNLITDVAGLLVGHAEDVAGRSGTTAVVLDRPSVASVAVMGGAPGTRETDLLRPEQTVQGVDALVLSGGSAYGLDAASGVMRALAARGRGFPVGSATVPIVPAAILFDLASGGDKPWLGGGDPPYRALGHAAATRAGGDVPIGSVGAGLGATTARLRGGLGSASTRLDDGTTVGALVAVNAVGAPTIGDGPHFWAAPFEIGDEFGGLGWPPGAVPGAAHVVVKAVDAPLAATTIAVVATDADLTKAEARRLAVAAHDGLARALWPAHTPFDGDLVFAVSTGRRPLANRGRDLLVLCAVAASTLARAVARGVFAAAPSNGGPLPAWSDRFGGRG